MNKSLGDFPTNVRVVGVEEFDQASFDERAPLIIRGAVTRASKKWTDEWLLQRFGNVSCWVNLDSRPTIEAFRKNMDLVEYLDILEKSKASDQPPGYLFQPRMELEFEREADLLEDLDVPAAIWNLGDDRSWMLFVGPALSGTLPHIHRNAINILARGRKRWSIFVGADQHEDWNLLQEYSRSYGSGSQAKDWFVRECPKLRSRRRVRLWECVQEAGDCYTPQLGSSTLSLTLSQVSLLTFTSFGRKISPRWQSTVGDYPFVARLRNFAVSN